MPIWRQSSGRASTDREERAKYYEQKAVKARAKSEAMTDFQARETMMQVVEMWELLVRKAKNAK